MVFDLPILVRIGLVGTVKKIKKEIIGIAEATIMLFQSLPPCIFYDIKTFTANACRIVSTVFVIATITDTIFHIWICESNTLHYIQ